MRGGGVEGRCGAPTNPWLSLALGFCLQCTALRLAIYDPGLSPSPYCRTATPFMKAPTGWGLFTVTMGISSDRLLLFFHFLAFALSQSID